MLSHISGADFCLVNRIIGFCRRLERFGYIHVHASILQYQIWQTPLTVFPVSCVCLNIICIIRCIHSGSAMISEIAVTLSIVFLSFAPLFSFIVLLLYELYSTPVRYQKQKKQERQQRNRYVQNKHTFNASTAFARMISYTRRFTFIYTSVLSISLLFTVTLMCV